MPKPKAMLDNSSIGDVVFSSGRRHTSWPRDWSSDVCSSDLGLCLRARLLHQRFELVLGGHDLHAATAAARCRLDEHGIADLGRERLGLLDIRDRAVGTRSEEHTSELQSRGHLVCRLLLEKKK